MRSTGLRLSIGDDCALLQVKPGEEIAVTTDLSIAGRHFRLDWHPPEAVGHRTLARGLSDLAAMGAHPVAAFLSLGLPRELTKQRGRRLSWIDRFFEGFLALAERHKTPLAGGDLAESPVAVADILLVGAVPRGKALLRSGAQEGDLLYVTGALGGSAAGLDCLRKVSARNSKHVDRRSTNDEDPLTPHLWPEPRIQQGLWLQRRGRATAAIDLSDGLSTDLGHICMESGVGAEIDEASLPVFGNASRKQALHGGEDYELLFAARPVTRIPKRIDGISVTQIGRVIKARSGQARVVLLTKAGPQPLSRGGWEHFA
jgi:thiamine-monophosphate kinase